MGATLFSSAGRRGATIGFTAMKENAAFVAPLLVTECSFEKWDVKEAQTLAGVEAAEATSNAQVRLFVNMHTTLLCVYTFYVWFSLFFILYGLLQYKFCSLTYIIYLALDLQKNCFTLNN